MTLTLFGSIKARPLKPVSINSALSAHKAVNYRSKYVTQVQQRPESPTVTLTWNACKYEVHKLHQRYIWSDDARALRASFSFVSNMALFQGHWDAEEFVFFCPTSFFCKLFLLTDVVCVCVSACVCVCVCLCVYLFFVCMHERHECV